MTNGKDKTLREIIPLKELAAIFGDELRLEEFGKSDISEIIRKKPECLHGLAGNIWNRIVQKNWCKVDSQQLAPYFKKCDPKLHNAISKVVGEDVIRDIYFVRAWRGVPRKDNLVMEVVIADVYRSDLQLADITFCNPGKPIAPVDRRFKLQTHKGLGLFPTLLENMNKYGLAHGHEQLTLTAAFRDLVALFRHHGFVVENSLAGKIAMQCGAGIPMERDVR